PVALRSERSDHMQALAAGGAQKALQAQRGKAPMKPARAVQYILPDRFRAGVEVKDQPVRIVWIGGGRSPGMDFQDAELSEPDQTREIALDQMGCRLAIGIGNGDLLNDGRCSPIQAV